MQVFLIFFWNVFQLIINVLKVNPKKVDIKYYLNLINFFDILSEILVEFLYSFMWYLIDEESFPKFIIVVDILIIIFALWIIL